MFLSNPLRSIIEGCSDVTPAQAGVQYNFKKLDSRFRGNDKKTKFYGVVTFDGGIDSNKAK
jgi:hypothetical protein